MDGIPIACNKHRMATYKIGSCPTPMDGLPIADCPHRRALLESAWEAVRNQNDSPFSVDTSTPRTYDSNDSDGLSAMTQRTFPSTPIRLETPTHPSRQAVAKEGQAEHHPVTPLGGNPSNPKMALLSRAMDILDQPDSPCSVDTSTPRTYASDDSDGLSAMMQRTFPNTPAETPTDLSSPMATPPKTPIKLRTPQQTNFDSARHD